jgi:hypothetical protein
MAVKTAMAVKSRSRDFEQLLEPDRQLANTHPVASTGGIRRFAKP